MRLALSLSVATITLAMMTGCAAQPAAPGLTEVKQEALAGDVCSIDTACDWGEYCDLPCAVGQPCAEEGICRTQTRFEDIQKWDVPDNDPIGVMGTIVIDRPPSSVNTLWVIAPIRHTYIGDLRVVLRSPMGTEIVLLDREGGSTDDVLIARELSDFDGEDPAGTWNLLVSDLAAQDVGTLGGWHLEMGFAPAGPEPDARTDVWASVDVVVESLHPYRDGTSLGMNLRRFTGDAHRMRIHFSRLDTEPYYDFVRIIDNDTGEALDHFSGQLGVLTTQEYETGNVEVTLNSDHSITDWGFRIDRIDVFGAGCLEDTDCDQGYDCPTTRICVHEPCFQVCMPEEPSEPGSEGDPCTATEDCVDGLYCDSQDICAPGGSCDVRADCSNADNEWIHILCVGHATCEAGQCGWVCDPGPAFCQEGYTRVEGCNTCTCLEGQWACTEMACSPEAELGEACDMRFPCVRGLVCDRGRYEGALCGRWDGICREPGTQERCDVADTGPVCACTGQSFESECARQGYSADWASDGRCELSRVIPDADLEGISAMVFVAGPSNSRALRVQVEIDHSYRGDLEVWLMAPNGTRHTLTDRQGRSADDFHFDGVIDVLNPLGGYTLHVVDHASLDVGVLRFFNIVPEDPAPSLGQACFIANGMLCDYGEFCHYLNEGESISCGTGVGGICEERPSVCPPSDSPVCSCPGDQYINECMSHAAGYSFRYDSECPW